ncbi:pyrroloquinoline quinone-dependent dehydrogenase [Sphingobium aquiterrae]|uniref:pyrroloquinoline quinone-dependent dehydrogenase n=1 Tax=Sphingobium aquiterrae TaxID=2038656 RepID=UPI00301A3EF3
MKRRHLILLGTALAVTGCGQNDAVDLHGGPVAGWPIWGGDEKGTHFSANEQITPANVAHLKVAWTYRTGDIFDEGMKVRPAMEATPILANNALYLCSPRNRVIALDPQTGKQKWMYDAKPDTNGSTVVNCRGVAYWQDSQAGSSDASCAKRIFAGTIDGRLLALDADSGRRCTGFGKDGAVSLKGDLGPIELPGQYGVSSAPTVVGDRVIVGSKIIDFRHSDMPSGVVRAFNTRTGAIEWAWTGLEDDAPTATVRPAAALSPAPLPPTAATDGATTPKPATATPAVRPAFPRSTPNVWAPPSVDLQRRLIFLPTGNPQVDFYAGGRGDLDRYGSAVVAVNSDTGKRVWSYQLVHHDIWDYDTPAQPLLFDYKAPDGKMIPALVQTTKMGFVFILNRETGKPIFPVDEVPVPRGGVRPDLLSPTQPMPRLADHRLLPTSRLTEKDMWGFTEIDRQSCVARYRELKNQGMFTPIDTQPTLIYPVTVGGSNWGGASYDPRRNLLIINTSNVAGANSLKLRSKATPEELKRVSLTGTPYIMKFEPFLSAFGAPCNRPPWGRLTALDMNTGKKKWEVPLGSTRDQAPWPVWSRIGVPNQGGTLSTASGLVFIGAASDNFIRAFSTETGAELWKARLPAGGQATPMSFRLNSNGKQYIVISAGGHGALGTKHGDYLIAYALP